LSLYSRTSGVRKIAFLMCFFQSLKMCGPRAPANTKKWSRPCEQGYHSRVLAWLHGLSRAVTPGCQSGYMDRSCCHQLNRVLSLPGVSLVTWTFFAVCHQLNCVLGMQNKVEKCQPMLHGPFLLSSSEPRFECKIIRCEKCCQAHLRAVPPRVLRGDDVERLEVPPVGERQALLAVQLVHAKQVALRQHIGLVTTFHVTLFLCVKTHGSTDDTRYDPM
jgi:hypothetical protein